MKRIERNTYNALRKSVTAETINVEIPVDYTHEGRQGIHEMLTIEKGLYVTGINWNNIQKCYCIHYERAYTETAEGIKAAQETADIDTITEGMTWSDYTWNGYKKPSTETTETTTTEEEEEEQNMKQIENAVIIARKWFDRVNGNTYHSARIIINGGELDSKNPFEYGYGDSYMTTATEIALENGYSRDGMNRDGLRSWLKSNAIIDCVNVNRKEL